jgi:hypothetical protein
MGVTLGGRQHAGRFAPCLADVAIGSAGNKATSTL